MSAATARPQARPEVFTRKASGLVRVMSPYSAFVYNILTMGIIFPWVFLISPTAFPGGKTINAESAQWLANEYGFAVGSENGLTACEMVEASARGELDLLYCLGGNFLRTLPDPDYVAKAMANVPLRVHQDIILTDQMFIEGREGRRCPSSFPIPAHRFSEYFF